MYVSYGNVTVQAICGPGQKSVADECGKYVSILAGRTNNIIM